MRGDGGGDLAGDELEAAARRFVVEEDAARRMQAVGFAVVARQLEAGDLACRRWSGGWNGVDSFCGTSSTLPNISLDAGEIEAASRRGSFEGREHKVRAVDIGVEGGELVLEG